MDKTVSGETLKGTLNAPPSKSQTHRALIAASMADGLCNITNQLSSDDIEATQSILKHLGAFIDGETVKGPLKVDTSKTLNANASGSTLRFMIPIALLFDHYITFDGKERLPKRPLEVYEETFKDSVHYEYLSSDYLPLKVRGPLKANDFKCRGDISSQFISGLLFALPLLKGDSTITLTTPLESLNYVDMTLDTLKHFGIEVEKKGNQLFIKGNQTYKPRDLKIEGDYSQAAFFIVAGMIAGDITIKGLNPSSLQGDKKIIEIIQSIGGNITYDETVGGYHVLKSTLHSTTIDLTDIPDLGPILMVLAAQIQGKTTFKGLKRLVFKESNRLDTMKDIVRKLGAKAWKEKDTLIIEGVPQFKGNQTFDAHDDHRLAMALTIATLKADGPLTIKGASCISKSYPLFFEDFKHLGGHVLSPKEER